MCISKAKSSSVAVISGWTEKSIQPHFDLFYRKNTLTQQIEIDRKCYENSSLSSKYELTKCNQSTILAHSIKQTNENSNAHSNNAYCTSPNVKCTVYQIIEIKPVILL